jgi:hypothetical protein
MANATWQVFKTRSREGDTAAVQRDALLKKDGLRIWDLDPEQLLTALKQSWDGTQFRCYHTGLPLETNDSWSPLCLTWEKQETALGESVVIVAAVIRGLFSELSPVAFQEVCQALRDRMQDDNAVSLRSIPIRRRLRAHRLKWSRPKRR